MRTLAIVWVVVLGAAATAWAAEGTVPADRFADNACVQCHHNLAGRARQEFALHQLFIGPARRVAGAEPDEMKQLMGEDAGKLGPCAIEGHAPPAQERSGVDGPVTATPWPTDMDDPGIPAPPASRAVGRGTWFPTGAP